MFVVGKNVTEGQLEAKVLQNIKLKLVIVSVMFIKNDKK